MEPLAPATAEPSPPRAPWRRALPYLVGTAMFALAIYVLHGTLSAFHLDELKGELGRIGWNKLGLAVLFTALSFVALMGYEHSALRLIGRRVPLRELCLASFVTQSISHSTGFAFVTGATLRYQLYAARGLGLGDVARIQLYFTTTFTLGVSTLAGSVLLLAPWHIAAATGLPVWAWRLGAATALLLVAAYIAWGVFFHRPIRLGRHVITLPDALSTLIQIFWGVADLFAVAAALYMLLPTGLGLSYLEVLAIFMAAIVAGLMSHVPGSLGVFESAVVLLVQPPEPLTLPLIGALLAFRACYYLLPLLCGVSLLTLIELRRWLLLVGDAGPVRRLLPLAVPGTSLATLLAGAVLLLSALTPVPEARAERLAAALPPGFLDLGTTLSSMAGVGLVVLARGLQLSAAAAWRGSIILLVLGIGVCLLAAERVWLVLLLAVAFAALLLCRRAFTRPVPDAGAWLTPAWLGAIVLAVGLAVIFITRS